MTLRLPLELREAVTEELASRAIWLGSSFSLWATLTVNMLKFSRPAKRAYRFVLLNCFTLDLRPGRRCGYGLRRRALASTLS